MVDFGRLTIGSPPLSWNFTSLRLYLYSRASENLDDSSGHTFGTATSWKSSPFDSAPTPPSFLSLLPPPLRSHRLLSSHDHSKTLQTSIVVRDLRLGTDTNITVTLPKAKVIKSHFESLDRSNAQSPPWVWPLQLLLSDHTSMLRAPGRSSTTL
ncbi:syntaxin [Striga asiatica]|uniref:Syntaxin n=1 Tax=Striga asiatica TaxID=4170 RepID=A0A5A7PTM1_STRAF|nr:syntaxin [Striga asiatica]